MKTRRYLGIMMMAASLVTATSCSDFDDYNKVPTDVTASVNSTLWENISSNPELSNFARLVKKSGFDTVLAGPSFYTVWAPLNGTYNADSLLQLNDAVVLKEFVENHIAQSNFLASGQFTETLRSLNQKAHAFEGSNADYMYAGVTLAQSNLPSKNGTLHVLNGQANFYPSIMEYIQQVPDQEENLRIDSICNYLNSYQISTLNKEKSVIGPVVNGRQTYIDSVMDVRNSILDDLLNAKVSEEDSSYTAFLPTNQAWNASFARLKSCFRYPAKISSEIYTKNDKTNSYSVSTKTQELAASVLQDSLTKVNVVRNMFFSNNNSYNQWLVGKDKKYLDSLYSTNRGKLSEAETSMLPHVMKTVKMSNGEVRIVDSLAFNSWDTYNPELELSARSCLAGIKSGSAVNIRYIGDEQNYNALVVSPSSAYSRPELYVYLPGVLATKYNIYVQIFRDKDAGEEKTKPNQLNFQLSYCDANGNLKTADLLKKVSNSEAFVDTIMAGTFEFPVAYRGLKNEYAPNIKITSSFSQFNKTDMATYTRTIRIGSIILRPVEYDEYLAKKKK